MKLAGASAGTSIFWVALVLRSPTVGRSPVSSLKHALWHTSRRSLGRRSESRVAVISEHLVASDTLLHQRLAMIVQHTLQISVSFIIMVRPGL